MPAVEVWLIEFEQLCPMLNNKSWLAASSVARISASVPLAEPSRDQAWSSRRRSAHIALRLLLARSAGIVGVLAPFEIGLAGKPGLASGLPPYFSLSHSGDRALAALSAHAGIGIDIEAPRSPRIPPRRREQIIAAAIEMAAGEPLPGATADQQFLQAWVRLEAVAKCSGEGMGRLLGRLGIVGGHPEEAATLADRVSNLRDVPLDRGFVAAVAGPVAHWDGLVHRFPATRDGIERLVHLREGSGSSVRPQVREE